MITLKSKIPDKVINFGKAEDPQNQIEITVSGLFTVEQAKELDKLQIGIMKIIPKINKVKGGDKEAILNMTNDQIEGLEGMTEYKWSIYDMLPTIIKKWNIEQEGGEMLPINQDNVRRVLGSSETGTTQTDLFTFSTSLITLNAGTNNKIKKNIKMISKKQKKKL